MLDGSDIHKATELMLQVLVDCEEVLKEPEPFVLFKDFGDSSLNFTIVFWVNIKKVIDQLKIESDVRYLLNDTLTKAGIVIAFPQRDVHIDAEKPLAVTITKT